MEKLREELAKLLFDWIAGDWWEWDEVDEAIQNHYRVKAGFILFLPALREIVEKATGTCEWVRTNDMLLPACITRYLDGMWDITEYPYCPGCGRKIGVKDGKD